MTWHVGPSSLVRKAALKGTIRNTKGSTQRLPDTAMPIRYQKIVFLLFLSYLGYYLGRTNLSVVLPELVSSQRISYAMGGLIGTISHILYAVAQPVNGSLVDRFGAKRLLLFGVAMSALCNIMFGLAPYAGIMVSVWGLNGVFQACGWPAVVKLASRWLPAETRGKSMSLIHISTSTGTLLTWVVASTLIAMFNWQFAFWGPAILMCTVLLVCALGLPNDHQVADTDTPKAATKQNPLKLLRVAEIRWAAFVLALVNLVLNSVLLWVPTYLADVTGTLGKVNWHVFGYPVVGAVGVLLAGQLYDRYRGKNQAHLLIPMLSALAVGLFVFSVTSPNSAFNTLALISMGLCVTASNFIITGPISLQIGGAQNRAAIAGIIDGVGYIGSAVGTVTTGWLVQQGGWHPALLFWIMSALLGVAGAVVLAKQMTKLVERGHGISV